jgi:hypothetical protein
MIPVLYAGMIPVLDNIFQMKMPGTRPGIFVLAVWREVDR